MRPAHRGRARSSILPMVGALAVDSALLSWDRVRVTPTVAVTPTAAGLGVAGRF